MAEWMCRIANQVGEEILTHAIGKHILTVEEMQTVFFESGNILNERPIGRHPTMPEEDSYQ